MSQEFTLIATHMCILQTVMQNWKVKGPPLFSLLFIFVYYPSNLMFILFKWNGYVRLVFIFMEFVFVLSPYLQQQQQQLLLPLVLQLLLPLQLTIIIEHNSDSDTSREGLIKNVKYYSEAAFNLYLVQINT